MRRAFLFASLCVAMPAVAHLSDIYDAAIAHNRSYRSNLAHLKSQSLAEKKASAAWLPHVSLSSHVSRAKEGAHAGLPSEQDTEKGYAISLGQTVFDGSAMAHSAEARAQTRLARLQMQALNAALLEQVAHKSLHQMAQTEVLNAAMAREKAVARLHVLTESAAEAGLLSDAVCQEAEAAVQSASFEVLQAKLSLKEAQLGLRVLTGKEENLSVGFQKEPHALPQASLLEVLAQAKQESLLQKEAKVSWEAALANKQAANAALWPVLKAQASYMHASHSNTTPFFAALGGHDTRVGLQLSLPIFEGGALRHAKKQAAYEALSAREHYQDVQVGQDKAIRLAFHAVKNFEQQVKAAHATWQARCAVSELKQAAYEVGNVSMDILLEAYADEQAAHALWAKALADYGAAWVHLKRLTGTLRADDLSVLEKALTHQGDRQAEHSEDTCYLQWSSLKDLTAARRWIKQHPSLDKRVILQKHNRYVVASGSYSTKRMALAANPAPQSAYPMCGHFHVVS